MKKNILLLVMLGLLTGISQVETTPQEALYDTATNIKIAQAKSLLNEGAKAHINDRFYGGRTILMRAAWGRNLPIIELLVQEGADVSAVSSDYYHLTPLGWYMRIMETFRHYGDPYDQKIIDLLTPKK